MTLKQHILDMLRRELPSSLTYRQLARYLNAHEPSVRRAVLQLCRERKIRYTSYDPPVTVQFLETM